MACKIAVLILVGLVTSALAATEVTSQSSGSAPASAPSASQGGTVRSGLVWLTDLPQAQARAKAEGKAVLLFFHGSDWCPPCVEMEREVFGSPQFAQFARKALCLVDVDFPSKRKQDEALRQANLGLRAKFNLSKEPDEDLPTVVLLNEEGHTVFQELGYATGSSEAVLARLQQHAKSGAPTPPAGPFQDLSVDDFAKMAADKNNVILDVRTPGEFNAGHITGAVNLDVNGADFEQKAGSLDKSKVFLVHCASGVRSVRACEKLSQLKFPRLYNLPGGFKAWVKAGQPVEK